ncbi:MAG TPA: hypothetical protein DCL44_07160 [Elusimicrobia bacterium]|nr:hypothetical protein [Elusimicrobiota bacterium]
MRTLLLGFLILLHVVPGFALDDAKRKNMLLDAEMYAGEYLNKAVEYLKQHGQSETGISDSWSKYEKLQDSFWNPGLQVLLQSEADADLQADCKRHAAVYCEGKIVLCNQTVDGAVEDTSGLINTLLHERVHFAQARGLTTGGTDSECQATEMAGITMLISDKNEIENDYTAQNGRCNYLNTIFRNFKKIFKISSFPLASGEIVTVNPNLTAADVKESDYYSTPGFIYIGSKEEAIVKKLRQSRQWRIISIERGVISLESESFKITLVYYTRDLDIYADSFEKALNNKVKVTVPG